MYRKFKTRRLIFAVAVLLLLVAGIYLKDYFKGDRSFRQYVLSVDTAKIESITISSALPIANTIRFSLEQNHWKVSENNLSYTADPQIMRNMIDGLGSLKIETLAGNSNSNWSEFEVTDSAAIKVSIEEKGKKDITTLFIGKFSYQQPNNPYDRQGRMSSYVRVAGQEETFSVQGFLRMSFTPEINNYRSKFLSKTSSEFFDKLTFTYPGDSSFVMVKDKKSWLVNGIPADSLKAEKYFNMIEHLSCSDFADTIKHQNDAIFTLKIEGPGLTAPIEIKGFQSLYTKSYVLNSSYNPEAFFNGSSQKLVSNVFPGRKNLLK